MKSEKVKEIKKALKFCTSLKKRCRDCSYSEIGCYKLLKDILTLINELEECSEKWQKLCADEVALNTQLKECIKELETLCNKTYEDLTKEIDRLENRVKELEEGIAQSMLGCEFLPECTKEIAEKIWNMSKITVDATKHIVQGREYLHLDALKEIIKSCGVEIKE